MKILVLGLAALTAGVVVSRPPSHDVAWNEMLERTSSLSIWLAFDPINCRIKTRTIKQLAALRNARLADVRIVLARIPDDSLDRGRILDAFGTDLPLQVDERGQWSSALEHYQLGSAMIVVARSGQVEVVGAPDMLSPMLNQMFGGEGLDETLQ